LDLNLGRPFATVSHKQGTEIKFWTDLG
jgi:hypothetical protein